MSAYSLLHMEDKYEKRERERSRPTTLDPPPPRAHLLATGGAHAHGGLEAVVDPPLEAFELQFS